MAGELKDREIVVLEPVVETGFRQHQKKSDQHNAGQEINRWNSHRNGAGISIDQHHQCIQGAACNLKGERLAALADSALYYIRRQAIGERERAVRTLALKR